VQLLAVLGDVAPVDGVDVAEQRVALDVDGAADDVRERVQADFLQVLHLVDDEREVEEQRVAPDDGQVGEEARQAAQPLHAEQQQVARDLAQLGERVVAQLVLAGVHQHDLHRALHYLAAPQPLEQRHVVANVYSIAHCEHKNNKMWSDFRSK
jgi:hypothetical protein